MGKTTKLDCSPLRIANIRKLRALKKTYREIGGIYNVSGVQIHYWLNGRKVKRLREMPERCELCGEIYKKLNHHHWGNPKVGMWLCPRCHMAAEALDEVPGFASKYLILKEAIQLLEANGKAGLAAHVEHTHHITESSVK